MKSSLMALIELAAANKDVQISEDLSVEEQYPELVAPLMRYEMLLKDKIDSTIQGHLSGIKKTDLIQSKTVYDKGYFLNLPIPYDGIQQLCQELLALCKKWEVIPSEIWVKYAEGVFDWESDIDYMSTL